MLAVEGEEMTVGAPNRFAADCLRDKMGRSIVEATSRILGRKVNVDYEAAGARVTHRLSSKWNPNTRTDYDAGREQMCVCQCGMAHFDDREWPTPGGVGLASWVNPCLFASPWFVGSGMIRCQFR